MRVVSVVGARPQFIKLAPVAKAFTDAGIDHRIVHTGQHYDAAMSDVFFADLHIPAPHAHLGVGSGSHAAQTASMLTLLEPVLEAERPDWVLVYGDTNSTLAAALAAVKLHLPLAHLEAGLRSFNRRMPEEHNRVLTDHAADLLLAPTAVALEHLTREGLADRTVVVGDVMADVCLATRDGLIARGSLPPLLEGPYYVATVHRAESTDDSEALRSIVAGLAAATVPVVLFAHPRLRSRAAEFGIELQQGAIDVREPVGYPEMVAAVMGAHGVITDSGGLQKEAYLLETPCTTLRSETEWVETLHDGWNSLVPDVSQLGRELARPRPTAPTGSPFGTGAAALEVVAALTNAG